MGQNRARAAALALAACALAWPAAARQEDQAPLTVVFLREAAGVTLDVSGRAPFEDGAVLFLPFRYGGQAQVIHWHRVTLRGGRFALTIGPFEKRVLSGRYVLEAWFILNQQPLAIREAFRRARGVDIEHQELVGSVEVDFGDALARLQEEDEILRRLEGFLKETAAGFETLVEAYAAARPKGGPARATAAISEDWTHGAHKRAAALDGHRDAVYAWKEGFLFIHHADWLKEIEDLSLKVEELDGAWVERIAIEAHWPDPASRPDPQADLQGAAQWDADIAFAERYLEVARNREEKLQYLLERGLEDMAYQIEDRLAAVARKRATLEGGAR